MSEYLFKATRGNNATHGGTYTYRKNRWTRHETPVPCESGWHLAEGKQVLTWLAPTLWLAEIHPDAEVIRDVNKLVASKIRVVERIDTWNDRTARLFAADCAEDALFLLLDPDPRSVEAVAVARRFANGNASQAELDVARAAAAEATTEAAAAWATAAAGAAAWVAAGDAACAAAGVVAGDAARDAARAAAWFAARDAAWDAAWAAARDRQYRRLLGYLELEADDE